MLSSRRCVYLSEKDLDSATVTTVYTYDGANQLNTAQQGSITWQYTYDANGSLISDGVKELNTMTLPIG